MKRYPALLAVFLLAVLLLTSCGGETPSTAETTLSQDTTAPVETTPPVVNMEIIRDGAANYTIVRPENGDQATVSAASLLRTQIEQQTGTAPALTTDWIKPGAEYNRSTPEILIGNTGYPESAEALQGISYGDYTIKQIGNKLVINAWDPDNLNRAISTLLTSLAEVGEGTLIVPGGITHTETVNEILGALPIYTDEDFPTIYPTGNDNHLVLIESTTPHAYAAYCTELEKAGFTRYTGTKMADNEFATYTSDQYVINAGFYDHYDEVRIIIEPDTALPPLESVDSGHTVQPSFTSIGLEHYYNDPDKPLQNGQSYIWQLADGSFLILDGGVNRTYDAKTLYEFMREHAPDPDNIVISAWILTHAHGDHDGCFSNFCASYYINRVTIKHIIANYPSDKAYSESGIAPLHSQKHIDLMIQHSENGWIKAHAGQTFHFGGAVVEILYTYESHLPGSIEEFNTTSLILTVNIAGQQFLITGDATNAACTITANMFGDYLESDFVQIAHHGAGVGASTSQGVRDLYSFAQAPIILWPSGQRAYNAYYTETRNAHALNLPSTKEIFVAGSRITTLPLPYTAGTSGYDTILK